MDENTKRITGAGKIASDKAFKLSDGYNNVPDRSVFDDQMRVLPRQVSTGTQRGEQIIDGSQIVVSPDGEERIITGRGPNSEFGLFGVQVNNKDPSDLTIGWSDVGRTRSVYDDTNIKRMMSGKFPDGSIKIKLSQPTFDVATATDDQLIWSSDFNLFKIVSTGTVTIPGHAIGEAFSDIDLAHNLGFVPGILAYTVFDLGGGELVYTPLPSIDVSFPGGTIDSIIYVQYVTDSIVRFQHSRADTAAASDPVDVRYYLVRETASTSS